MVKKSIAFVSLIFMFAFVAGVNPLVSHAQIPPVTLTASPYYSITNGQSTTLSWNATGYGSCSLSSSPTSNGWTGSVGTSGSTVVSPTQTTTYNVNCLSSCPSGSNGNIMVSSCQGYTQSASTIIIVSPVASPTITSINPSQGSTNMSGTIYGSGLSGGIINFYLNGTLFTSIMPSSNSDSQLGFNFPGDPRSSTGQNPTTLQVKVTNTAGTSNSLDLTFSGATNSNTIVPVISSFTANPTSINYGQSTVLTITGTNLQTSSTNCNMSSDEPRYLAFNYSTTVSPAQTTKYTVVCYYVDATGNSASVSSSVTVAVVGSPYTQTTPQLPTVDLKVNGSDGPISVDSGKGNLNLTWTSSFGNSTNYTCWTGQGFTDWNGTLPTSGWRTVNPSVDLAGHVVSTANGIRYEINCTNPATNLAGTDNVIINFPMSTITQTQTTYSPLTATMNPNTTSNTTVNTSPITVTTPVGAMTYEQKQELIKQIQTLLTQLIAELNAMLAQQGTN